MVKDDAVVVAWGWGTMVFSCVVVAIALFVIIGSPFILTQGVWLAEMVAIGTGVWGGWIALTWYFKATLYPDGRLEFRRVLGTTEAKVASVNVIELVKDADEIKSRRFVIKLGRGRIEIAENRSGRNLVNAILTLRPKTRLKGYERPI